MGPPFRLGAISASMLSRESVASNLVSGNEGGMAGMFRGASIVAVVIRDIRDRLVLATQADTRRRAYISLLHEPTGSLETDLLSTEDRDCVSKSRSVDAG